MEIVIVLILTNLFILLVMRSLNENNAKYLLAGYNTMSKEERENFKIKEYLIYLKKFWNKLLLYNSTKSPLSSLLTLGSMQKTSGIFELRILYIYAIIIP